jgi:hypothetical protein
MRSELARLKWNKLQEGVVLAQALVQSVLARNIVRVRKRMAAAADALDEAIEERDIEMLTSALELADTVADDADDDSLEKLKGAAVALLQKLGKEAGAKELLQAAIDSEDEGDLMHALAEAGAIGLAGAAVTTAKTLLTRLTKLKQKEEAKGKEEQEEAAREALRQALADVSQGEVKRKALMVAVQGAEAVGLDYGLKDPLLEEARAAIEALIVSMDVDAALVEAMARKNRQMLATAVEKAEAAGELNYVIAGKLADAKAMVEALHAQDKAEEAVEAALKKGNEAEIEAAAEKARKAGVTEKSEALAKVSDETAKARRQAVTQEGRAGKKQLKEQAEGLSYLERMQELSKAFGKLAAYEHVRTKDMSVTYTKIPIKKPMTKLRGDSADIEQRAVSLFVSILGYMGERKIEYPEMLAVELLQDGLDEPEMRDEIYFQIIKQCSRNETKSLIRGWQLLVRPAS